jgi:EF-P beta-lysylation protein EpmB
MIHRKHKSEHTLQWKKLFADSCFGHRDFAAQGSSPSNSSSALEKIDNLFPIQVTQAMMAKVADPKHQAMLKQYLPDEQELITDNSFVPDPLKEDEATLLPGVIKKYAHRVLIITTNVCPIHCRYCFRKSYSYPKQNPNSHQFKQAIEYCANDKTINEVILSGGDPLSLEDNLLDHLVSSISQIPHINTIRLHTKYPSIIPERITPELLNIFKNTSLNTVFVFHINHPDEVTQSFCKAAKKIKDIGAHTLNQSVLLKGVNDDALILCELSHKLFAAGVLPYYLHMLDHALGNSHFHVSNTTANAIMLKLKSNLPGYLVPKLARELPGQANKLY